MKRTLPLALASLLLTACSYSNPTADTTLYASVDGGTHFTPPRLAATQVPESTNAARSAASTLIASMTEDQLSNTVLPLDHEAHSDWHYVPRRRRGLALGAMTDAQRHDLHRLLQTALSDSGYLKAMDIVWLESVLEELENRGPDDHYRDPGRYYLLFFGNPADAESAWGWRFEGHHLSLNFTYAGGSNGGVVTTPMFMGTAPAVVPSGLHAGKRILADEHNLAFAFIETLTDEQRDAMMIGEVPGDVVTGPGREASLREPAGIAWDDLTDEQSDKLFNLILVYTNRLQRNGGLSISAMVKATFNWDIHFAWAGSTNPDQPHYYRIYAQDRFVIEYCTRDGGVNHIHGVFHDLTDPLARDLLREHFEQHHAGE